MYARAAFLLRNSGTNNSLFYGCSGLLCEPTDRDYAVFAWIDTVRRRPTASQGLRVGVCSCKDTQMERGQENPKHIGLLDHHIQFFLLPRVKSSTVVGLAGPCSTAQF